MKRETERVKLMKENFIRLYNQGFSIQQIAEQFNVVTETVYNALGKIAENNGISRESLLSNPRKKEQIQAMKENFIKLHKKGLSAREIAKMFDLSEATVYRALKDIADANGISRESLLKSDKTEVEQVKFMKENFMELHQQGLSVPKIAEQFNLPQMVVYNALQEIADTNGVSRESLLRRESQEMFLMKASFMELHQQGCTILEIARKFNITKASVYRALGQIASENGVSRESLLSRPKKNKK